MVIVRMNKIDVSGNYYVVPLVVEDTMSFTVEDALRSALLEVSTVHNIGLATYTFQFSS